MEDHETTLSEDLLEAYAGDDRHSKYWRSLQTLKPIRFPKRKVQAPVDNAGLFSFITFSWLSKVIFSKNVLEIDDLPPLSKYDSARYASERLTRLYEEDCANFHSKPSIKRTIFRYIRTRMIASAVVNCIGITAQFVGPAFLIRRLVYFALLPSPSLGYGLALVIAFGSTEFIRAASNSFYWSMNYRTAVRTRGALINLLFRKITRLRSLRAKSVGQLVNLLSNDSQRLVDMILYGSVVLGTPLHVIATIVYIWYLLGWTSIVGVVVLFSYIPMQTFIAKLQGRYRLETVGITDSRVRIMNEILTCIKLIKMYAWENSFAKAVGKIRENEHYILSKTIFVQSIQVIIANLLPVLACVIMFLVHTLIGYPLTAPDAFTVLALFVGMRGNIAVLPVVAKAMAEVFISFRRMDSLLSMEEIEQYYVSTPSEDVAVEFTDASVGWDIIGTTEDEVESRSSEQVLFDITLSVPKERLVGVCGPVGSGKSSLISTILGHLRIQKGSLGLNGLIASVPQQAWIFHDTVRENILFGLPYDKEKYDKAVDICALVSDFEVLPDNDLTEIGERGINLSGGQKQRVSLARAVYSERDIILLDDPLSAVDAHVGKHIFFECIKKALAGKTIIFVTHQLQYLKDCDEVLLLKDGRITERGSHDELMVKEEEYALMIKNYNLCKEKVNSKKRSSEELDPNLFKKIMERRTNSKQTPVNISCHQNEDLNPDPLHPSNTSVETNSCGHPVPALDDSDEFKEKDLATADCTAKQDKHQVADDSDHAVADKQVLLEKNPIVLVKKEERQTDVVQMSTYLSYAGSAGGVSIVALVLLFIVASVGGTTALNWWLTYWINAAGEVLPCPNITSETYTFLNYTATSTPWSTPFASRNATCEEKRDPNITTNPDLMFYQIIYFVILVVTLLLVCIKSYLYSRTTLRAASGLQNKVLRSVLSSPMSFFDTTPTGRILNRFTTDLDEVDNSLPYIMEFATLQIVSIIIVFITIIVIFPWFTLVFVVLMTIFAWTYVSFRKSVIQLKTLVSTSRSPWFSLVTSTVQGLNTIHAYDKTNQYVETFVELLDTNSCPLYAFLCAGRWIGVRLNIISSIVTAFTALFAVLSSVYPQVFLPTTASFAGLALSYAITLSGIFHLGVRFSIETGTLFTSVERINEYIIGCPSETPANKKVKPVPQEWPEHGEIRFINVSMRYRPELPIVLKNVTFSTKPKEKVGIVGRTGSGKSSLGTVLFHLVDLESGKIEIDGLNIDEISLDKLRENLSIIPQDPVLFVGSVRYNLDPFQQYSDTEIWQALERSHMKNKISDLPEKLESEVVENGENFSVGERQLMCMARAILRHSRIIILDEATAAIDSETDNLVQDTIREAFADCTMLTIAHRLNTVLTCDKILVMDDGEVAEFDDPANLLGNHHSKFTRMFQAVTEEAKFDTMIDKAKVSA